MVGRVEERDVTFFRQFNMKFHLFVKHEKGLVSDASTVCFPS